MTYRVQVDASFLRTGYVEISADSAEEAVDVVKRLGKDKGATALDIQWQGAVKQGPVKVINVEAA